MGVVIGIVSLDGLREPTLETAFSETNSVVLSLGGTGGTLSSNAKLSLRVWYSCSSTRIRKASYLKFLVFMDPGLRGGG